MLEYQNIKIFLHILCYKFVSRSFYDYKNSKFCAVDTMLLVILTEKILLERFAKKESQKTNQEEFRVEKVIKRKGNKLFTQWKGYDNSFNNWTDKKGII